MTPAVRRVLLLRLCLLQLQLRLQLWLLLAVLHLLLVLPLLLLLLQCSPPGQWCRRCWLPVRPCNEVKLRQRLVGLAWDTRGHQRKTFDACQQRWCMSAMTSDAQQQC